MTKKEIKSMKNNQLIMTLVNDYAVIVSREGQGCKSIDKELNNIAYELKERGLLTDSDIEELNR